MQRFNNQVFRMMLAVAMLSLSALAFGQTPSITVGDETVSAGDTATIPVSFTNNGSVEAFNFKITYDTSVISSIDLSNCNGNNMSPGPVSCANSASGEITIFVGGFPLEVIASGQIGTIDFTVGSSSAGFESTPLTVSAVSFSDGASNSVTPGTITDGTISEAVADLNVTPSTLSFTDQVFNTTSSAQTVTISNDGSDGIDMSVTGLSFPSGFARSGGTCGTTPFTLSDGQSCTVGVVFSPVAVTSYSGSFSVTSDAASTTNGSVSLSGDGIPAPDGSLSISPSTYNFGDVVANSDTGTQTFTVTSNGGAGSIVTFGTGSFSVTGTGASQFEITTNTCSGTLSNGDTCSITVTFEPTSQGVFSATLNVSGSDANSASVSETAALSGTGAPPPSGDLSISPTSYDFGGVVANQGTDTQTFTITSSGETDSYVDISTVSVTGASAGDFSVTSNNCIGVLNQGSTCEIEITFEPTSVAADSGTLTVGGTDANSDASNATASLDGEGTPFPAGELTISPTSYDFGSLLSSSESDTQVFTISSTGDAGSEVSGLTVSFSTSPSFYSITANDCGSTLAQGSSCSVTVKFEPTLSLQENITLEAEGTDDNSDAVSVSADITGVGVTEARPTASPDGSGVNGVSLTKVVDATGAAAFEIEFGNEGNDTYEIACSYASGPLDPTIFSVTPSLPTLVAPSGSVTVTAGCALLDTETYQATLVCGRVMDRIKPPAPSSAGDASSPTEFEIFTYNLTCIGDATPIPATNRWGLMILALLMLTLAGWGAFRKTF